MNETTRTLKHMPHKAHDKIADPVSRARPLSPPSNLIEHPWDVDWTSKISEVYQLSGPTSIPAELKEDLNLHGIAPFKPQSDEIAQISSSVAVYNFDSASATQIPSQTDFIPFKESGPSDWAIPLATSSASTMASGPPDPSLSTVVNSAPTMSEFNSVETASFLALPTPTITTSPTIGPEPASAISSSTSSGATTSTAPSTKITGPIIAAIIVALLATLLLIAGILLFLRRRARNKRRGRELEKRAEWLDPAYIARVRMEMLGLDPNKVSHGHNPTKRGGGDATELSTWTGDTANAAVDMNAKWMNKGKMSGSLRHTQEQQHVRPSPRTRTTADGSPVQLPYNPSRNRSGGLQRLRSLDQLTAFPQEQQHPNAITDSPSEGEWLSNTALNLKLSSNSSLNDTSHPSLNSTAATERPVPPPPPPFDPRGSMRESQIGLALSLPWPELAPPPHSRRIPAQSRGYPYPYLDGGEPGLHVHVHREGALTGDGYEVLWRANRRREKMALRGSTVLEALPRMLSRGQSQGSDEMEGIESFVSQGSGETVVVGVGEAAVDRGHGLTGLAGLAGLGIGMYSRRGKEDDARIQALESKVQLLARMGSEEAKVDEMSKALEECRAKETDLRATAASTAAGGNEEVLKSMLRERLGMVKGIFGQG